MKLTVRAKLFGGFGLSVAALLGVSFIGYTGLQSAADYFTHYRLAARHTLTISEASSALTDARLAVVRYMNRPTPEFASVVNNALTALHAANEKGREAFDGSPFRADMDNASENASTYAAVFASYEAAVQATGNDVKAMQAVTVPFTEALSGVISQSISEQNEVVAIAATQVLEKVMGARLYVARFGFTGSPEDIGQAQTRYAAAEQQLRSLSTAPQSADLEKQTARLVSDFEKLKNQVAQFERNTNAAEVLRSQILKDTGPQTSAAYLNAAKKVTALQSEIGPEAQAGIAQTTTMALTLAGIFTLVMAAIALVLGTTISRAIKSITDCMKAVAAGDLTMKVYGSGRADEIGDMAAAVEVFQVNGIEKVRLEQEQEALKVQQEEDRRRIMHELADSFELAVGNIVDTVSSAAQEMQAAANTLSASAEETAQQSTAVSAASEEAAANVQTVASATEQLAASVNEIGRQAEESSNMSHRAVGDTQTASERIAFLSSASQKIGDVLGMISDIAGQTNLLALNATIEAARAGEAGKGFAVVATEVKALAEQTSRATQEISGQIAEIQSATNASVDAIQNVGDTVAKMNGIAATIAAAVEEQNAATSEIARNVQQASAGTSEVSANITGVSRAAEETGAAASQVLGSAGGLARDAEMLKMEVARFIAQVRAA